MVVVVVLVVVGRRSLFGRGYLIERVDRAKDKVLETLREDPFPVQVCVPVDFCRRAA